MPCDDGICAALDDASNFDGKQALGNAAGLAREVASKKISSEEETFSDLSNLIFVNNFKGIRAVVEPFLDGASDGASSAVKQALDDADAAVDGMCSDYTDGVHGVARDRASGFQAHVHGAERTRDRPRRGEE